MICCKRQTSCDYVAFHFSVAHHLVSDDIQTELVSELTKLFGHALSLHPGQKRSTFTDALSSIGQGLANFFQPHIQAVQQVKSFVNCNAFTNSSVKEFFVLFFPVL